ncbi:MAG: hypothetical protein WBP45_14750 [Daejeonella sp.]
MARRKTSSKSYDKATKRIASVKNIDANFDLGNGLTAESYQAAIDLVKNSMDEYNTQLSKADGLLNALKDSEKALRDWNERILTGVASKFGKDSSQYEEAGGKRKSDRKKRVTKTKTA